MNAIKKVKEFSQYKSQTDENLFVRKLRFGGLNTEQIAIVIDAIETTCNECFDGENNCQCWNDE